MKSLVLTFGLIVFFLATFGLANVLDIELINDPRQWMTQPGLPAALLGITLLVVDVVLPAPASLVMIYNGALFGMWGGALLSMVGGMLAAALGFTLGRRAHKVILRVMDKKDRRRASSFLARWGGLAIVVTRPVPVLAETFAIVAGTTSMSWPQLLGSSFLGLIPTTLFYAWTGTTAASLQNHTPIFVVVLSTAGLAWLIGILLQRIVRRKKPGKTKKMSSTSP